MNDKMPKKSFLSMQLDLSKFELATDEEKKQQDRMRESTSFLRDGLRRLKKNVISMICLSIVTFLVLVAFIVPLFYPYDFSTISANSYTANYMAPFKYSTRENIVREKSAVFIGWSYPNESTLEGYRGLPVIDSEEALEQYKDLFVTGPVSIDDKSVELFAVWSVDRDEDGVADFGANAFPTQKITGTSAERFTVTYDIGSASGTAPVDTYEYVRSDRVNLQNADVSVPGQVLIGWTVRDDVPVIDETNYGDYSSDILSGKTKISADTVFHAVFAVDADADGKADGISASVSFGTPKVNRYKVSYNMNMGVGEKPLDTTEYASGDRAGILDEIHFEKEYKKVFPHLLGTDEIGRDYAIRVVVGTRVSLLVGIIAAVIVVVIGVLYGAISGYFGGRVDLIMMRIVDIIYSLPDTLIIILLSVSLKDVIQESSFASVAAKLGGVGLVSILIVFAMLYWVGMARLVRGQVLSLREQEFVLAAKAMGVPPLRIILKHMLPNCISVIFISAALQIPSAIFTESFLSFLGVGVSMPMPSLGSLASDYRGQMTIAGRGYLFLIPSIVIFLIVLSLNLLGQGLRDAFDPKLKEVSK